MSDQNKSSKYLASWKFIFPLVALVFIGGYFLVELEKKANDKPKELENICFEEFSIQKNNNYTICLCKSLDLYRYKLFVTLKSGKLIKLENKTFFDQGSTRSQGMFCYENSAFGAKVDSDYDRNQWKEQVMPSNLKTVALLVWEPGSATEEPNSNDAVYSAHLDF